MVAKLVMAAWWNCSKSAMGQKREEMYMLRYFHRCLQ